jgi:hypothetical protein
VPNAQILKLTGIALLRNCVKWHPHRCQSSGYGSSHSSSQVVRDWEVSAPTQKFLSWHEQTVPSKNQNSNGTCNNSMPEEHVQTETQKVTALQEKFPTSPHAERLRLLRACKGDLDGAIAGSCNPTWLGKICMG